MAYPYYGYQPGYYQGVMPPAQDQLAQLRGAQYQPMPQTMGQPSPQMGGQSMIWVSGEAEALAYLVAPNSAVALWDSAAPVIYLKQADASGKPSIKVYDLVERAAQRAAQSAPVEYATREQFDALVARVDALTARDRPVRKNPAKEDNSDA